METKMRVPTNAPAEAIVQMEKQNFGYESQIETMTDLLEQNKRIIEDLEELATWDEVEEIDTTDNEIEDGLAPVSEFPGMIVPDQES
jgi:hypothetical protein